MAKVPPDTMTMTPIGAGAAQRHGRGFGLTHQGAMMQAGSAGYGEARPWWSNGCGKRLRMKAGDLHAPHTHMVCTPSMLDTYGRASGRPPSGPSRWWTKPLP